jgi:UDP-N-acetylmuramoylalanine--D-glutamate ligase
MKQATVIGLGKSGISAARLLQRQDWQVTISDRGNSETLQQQQAMLAAEGIDVKLADNFTPDAATMQRIVVSPGVPWDVPALVQARDLGIETIGEVELAWEAMSDIPWVAITGTNGKTTTTALVAAMFQAAGYDAPACGNIGLAICEVALAERRPDWVIAELSSYQIESSASVAPRIGIFTTLTPDHLARHKTVENYYNIKSSLLKRSTHQILNGDDPYLRSRGTQEWQQAVWTSVAGKASLLGDVKAGAYLQDAWVTALGELVMPANLLKMVGTHNQQNLLMSALAARIAGVGKEAIATAMSSFPGVEHRLEQIVTWNGIDFINDSKATNYDAAEVGLASVNAPAILIAGGEAKEGDDVAWLNLIKDRAAAVLLIGSAASAFAQRLSAVGYEAVEVVETMDRAVTRGAELAQQLTAKVVLLSPACASFDQYPNFEQRGEHFRQLCQQL